MKNRKGSSYTSWWKHKRPEGKRAMNKYERKEAKANAKAQIPYAQLRFNGDIHEFDQVEFESRVAYGALCGCDECLDCRCLEYFEENQ